LRLVRGACAGLIAFALFLPFLLWNAVSGSASFQYWASYSANHGVADSPFDFLAKQILIMNPLSVPLWAAGPWYFFSKRGARYLVFGWAYLILFVLFIALQGTSYFLAPAHPPLFAGGAMLCGAWRLRWPQWGPRWVVDYAVMLALVARSWRPQRCRCYPPLYTARSMAGAATQGLSKYPAMPMVYRTPWRIALAGRNWSS
jgi:hypothetical protein